jgi:hypothetical protein
MSNRRNKKKQDDFKGYVLFLISLTIVGFIVYLFVQESNERIDTDKLTNCPLKGGPARTAILIDTTDSLTRDQSLYLEKRLDEIVKRSETYDRFDIYFLDDKIERLTPTLSVCNPGKGDNKSALTNNVRRIKKNWDKNFYSKISSILNELESVESSNSSPIIEAIKYVSIDAFVGDSSQRKNLIIISDLLQFSKLLSHYNSEYSETTSRDNKNIYASLPYLDDVSVYIMYIVRPAKRNLQTNKHVVFWENLIKESGGRIAAIEMVK